MTENIPIYIKADDNLLAIGVLSYNKFLQIEYKNNKDQQIKQNKVIPIVTPCLKAGLTTLGTLTNGRFQG
jgi:hypothetical protein